MKADRSGILLTGASGFLAGALITRVLDAYADEKIYLLLRAEDGSALAERRARILAAYGIEGTRAERVIAVAGDIERTDLGLGERYEEVAGQVKEIYHSAASTNFQQKIEAARQINLQGTENVLNLARRAKAQSGFRRFHHVSTAYVSGDRTGLLKEDELDCGQGFFNTYEQSKYETELMLKGAMDEMPITIYRPSIIVGDSRTGRTAHFYVIYEPMKWVYSGFLTMLPCRPEVSLDIVPVDYVCDAMVTIGRTESSIGNTYHITSGPERSVTMSEMVEFCIREFNLFNAEQGKPPVARPEIVTPEMIKQYEDSDKAEVFFQKAWQQMQRHMPYAACVKLFDDSRTRAILERHKISCPSFREYLPAIVRFALENEFKPIV